jgi:hypothetical protein
VSREEAPTVNTGGEMEQILDHLLCASDPKIRRQDAKDALELHAALRAEVERLTTELQMERIAYGQACDDEKARADRLAAALRKIEAADFLHTVKQIAAAALEEKP